MNLKEHMYKEMLKRTIDNVPNYTEQTKHDLKIIVNAGKTPEEICEAILLYFAAIQPM